MKGKQLTHEDILKLKEGTMIISANKLLNEKEEVLKLNFNEFCEYKLADNEEGYYNSKSVKNGDIKVYEYIPEEQLNKESEEIKLVNQGSKIDYDKEYDGWEIIRLINKGILKKGDIYKRLEGVIPSTNKRIIEINFFIDDNNVTPDFDSFTYAKFKIIKQQKPLTFQETLDEKYNGKRFRVECNSEVMDNYYDLTSLLFNLSKTCSDTRLREIFRKAKFYVEE